MNSFELICSCGQKVKYSANNDIIVGANKRKGVTVSTTWGDTVVIQCMCGNKTRLPNVLSSNK